MAMDKDQQKVHWQGEVVSVQPRSTVWRYLTDNRTHRECGYNVFLKGEVMCVFCKYFLEKVASKNGEK